MPVKRPVPPPEHFLPPLTLQKIASVGVDKFPVQSRFLGTRCDVCFDYDASKCIGGTIVRDDRSPPYVTIIRLDDGRYVLASECQYATARNPPSASNDQSENPKREKPNE